ncbi:MAG: RecX family transcriptional regulator [Sphingomicrobium sp.]
MKPSRGSRRPRPPLDDAQLRDLGLSYVGRFATSRAKLRDYLRRKIRERGWSGAEQPDLEALADRFAASGYVDDSAFALGKARSLASRGYGKQRLMGQLRAAGIEEDHGAAARDHADDQAVTAAVRFAERKRIGPFGRGPADRKDQEKAIAAMVRAGHGFALARAIGSLPPGAPIDPEALAEVR